MLLEILPPKTEDLAQAGIVVGRDTPTGFLMVETPIEDTPAFAADILPGDLMTGFAGESVASATALTDLLDQQHPGNGVPLTWVDPDGQQYSAVVTLAPGPVG